jgi:hypothetical protein
MKKTKTKKKSSVRLVNQPLSEWRVFATTLGEDRYAPTGVAFHFKKVCYDSKGKPKGIVAHPDVNTSVQYADYEGKDVVDERPVVKAHRESFELLTALKNAWRLPILEVYVCGKDWKIREWKETKEIDRLDRLYFSPKKPSRRVT